ncbi:unnamed protein product [Protopolystoma xenopodis]|uniref:Uncharacterized protein n=1 Tax=Protopolystoma xenopodis TaxID=117903 RepID=A0A3S4ZTC7_9PLAT|nr:unnamed protein product [Protopolystoma xenopodis]
MACQLITQTLCRYILVRRQYLCRPRHSDQCICDNVTQPSLQLCFGLMPSEPQTTCSEDACYASCPSWSAWSYCPPLACIKADSVVSRKRQCPCGPSDYTILDDVRTLYKPREGVCQQDGFCEQICRVKTEVTPEYSTSISSDVAAISVFPTWVAYLLAPLSVITLIIVLLVCFRLIKLLMIKRRRQNIEPNSESLREISNSDTIQTHPTDSMGLEAGDRPDISWSNILPHFSPTRTSGLLPPPPLVNPAFTEEDRLPPDYEELSKVNCLPPNYEEANKPEEQQQLPPPPAPPPPPPPSPPS